MATNRSNESKTEREWRACLLKAELEREQWKLAAYAALLAAKAATKKGAK